MKKSPFIFVITLIVTLLTFHISAPLSQAAEDDVRKKRQPIEKIKEYREHKEEYREISKEIQRDVRRAENFQDKQKNIDTFIEHRLNGIMTVVDYLNNRSCGDNLANQAAIEAAIETQNILLQMREEFSNTSDENSLRQIYQSMNEQLKTQNDSLKTALKEANSGCILERITHILDKHEARSVKARDTIRKLQDEGAFTSKAQEAFEDYNIKMEAFKNLYTNFFNSQTLGEDTIDNLKNILQEAKKDWKNMIKALQEAKRGIDKTNSIDDDKDDEEKE